MAGVGVKSNLLSIHNVIVTLSSHFRNKLFHIEGSIMHMTDEQYYTLIHPYQDAMNLILTRLKILNHTA